ncbi:hypothetical protein BH20CHL6_BH20CHL6_20680 [soil metagenome]
MRDRPAGFWSAAGAIVLVGAVAAGAIAITTWPNDRLPGNTAEAALALDATDPPPATSRAAVSSDSLPSAQAPIPGPSHSAAPPELVGSPSAAPPGPVSSPSLASPEPVASPSPRPTITPSPSIAVGPSDSLRLERVTTISGGLSPKSVVSSQTGYFLAQNMMYRHTVTVYDRDFELVRTIHDRVHLARFGQAPERTIVQGAPVEAAFTPDGAAAYISQYSMYGPGYDRPGADTCHPDEQRDPSFVYRIDMSTLSIDQVLPVGATPKYLAVSPDGRFLLVANWCSYSLSVFDIATSEEVRRLPIGPYPRGITFTPDSSTAYIAVMGSDWIGELDMNTLKLSRIKDVGVQPRHLVMDPEGRYLYASLDEEASVVKIDLRTGRKVARARTGAQPRSMDIAPDGRSLYVVEYTNDTVAKIRTDTMEVVQRVETNHHPIGITYDVATRQVWVACYSGVIEVFRDV